MKNRKTIQHINIYDIPLNRCALFIHKTFIKDAPLLGDLSYRLTGRYAIGRFY